MDFQESLQFIIDTAPVWGYPTMLFFMIVEGPFTTMISAFLASMGAFNVFAVYGLSIVADVVGDTILFSIGRFGGRPVLNKLEKWFHLKKSILRNIEEGFSKFGDKFVFYAKISTGLSFFTFILAGMSEMKYLKFLKFSLLGGIIWSAFLVLMGFFFGTAAEQISKNIKSAGLVIFLIAIVTLLFIILYRNKNASSHEKNNPKS